MAKRCECLPCGCCEDATTTDDNGIPVCDECSSYYTTDDGDVVCSRVQGDDSCRHCGAAIKWSGIMTGAPGVSNWRDGSCSCREWTQTERGGAWEISESEAKSR